MNWVLSEEAFDLETALAWGFLDHLMLGTPAAPLRQALEASGLGEALTGGGLEARERTPPPGQRAAPRGSQIPSLACSSGQHAPRPRTPHRPPTLRRAGGGVRSDG